MMLQKIKKIFTDGAIYGVAQIAGKILNFLLIPFFTFVMQKSEMGTYADLYTWVAFLMIVLTCGSETAFFKFAQQIDENDPDCEKKQKEILSTAAIGVIGASIIFAASIVYFLDPLATLMRYDHKPEIILLVLAILLLDVWAALPKAELRRQQRAGFFVFVNLTAIAVNICTNLFLLLVLPAAIKGGWPVLSLCASWYDPSYIVHYVFIANICASATAFLLVTPIYFSLRWSFQMSVFKRILAFGFPLMFAGLAGMFNERADIQMIKYLLPEEVALDNVGIYGTVYKFAMLLIILNQAFRYAAEPFVFKYFKNTSNDAESQESKRGLALTTDWFVVVLSIGLICTLSARVFIEVLIDERYEEGLYILPILLLANVCYAIHTQLSFWYKLIDKTMYGMVITICGAIVTLVMTLVLIPSLGYEGAAWATLASYITMMVLSYCLGQKINPYPYNVSRAMILISVSMGFGMISWHFASVYLYPQVACLIGYCVFLWYLLGQELNELKNSSEG
jgi:O-antigen/teichoic acid export membrane protein